MEHTAFVVARIPVPISGLCLLQALEKKVESLQAELARARGRPVMRTMETTVERPASLAGPASNGIPFPATADPEGRGNDQVGKRRIADMPSIEKFAR